MSRIECGCSKVLERIQDGKDNIYAGECEVCSANSGRYDRSSNWREIQPIDQVTVDRIRDKFAKQDEEIDPPKKVGKKSSPTLHHIIPQSRGGKDENNLVTLPEKFHQALHTMFGNLTPRESVRFFEEVIMPGKKWTNAELEQLRTCTKESR